MSETAPSPGTGSPRQPARLGFVVRSAVAVALAVLAPLTLLTETRLKESVVNFFSGCIFVIDVRPAEQPQTYTVLGYLSGQAPDKLDLTFQAPAGQRVQHIKFLSGMLGNTASPYQSLLLHPLAGQTCPGKLCEAPSAPKTVLEPEPAVTIRLARPSVSSDYQFNVKLEVTVPSEAAKAVSLQVYSIADTAQAEGCRVERPNLFNWLMRQDKLGRFLAYSGLLFVFTMLVARLRPWE